MPVASLAGKRCFVTGAASGIGRATALAAARQGADLYLTDIDAEGLEGAAAAIARAGGRVSHAKAIDIRDHDAVVALAADVHAAQGSIDVVMNVAGVSTWGTIDRLQHSDWRQMIEVNLVGPISVLECFVPPMIDAGRGGHVVNVSSAAGLFGLPWHAAYSASKFGLRGVSGYCASTCARTASASAWSARAGCARPWSRPSTSSGSTPTAPASAS